MSESITYQDVENRRLFALAIVHGIASGPHKFDPMDAIEHAKKLTEQIFKIKWEGQADE